MSKDTISKIIFVVAIIICIILLLLPSPKHSAPIKVLEPKIPEKFIKNFSAKVPASSENTALNPIKLETNYNNWINSANQTPVLIGEYKNDIKTPVNLKIREISDNTYIFSTKYNNEQYYLGYSSGGNKEKDLEKGQLYWTKNKQDQISFLRNDKNILFYGDLQLYFKWLGNEPKNRKIDFGIFVLRNKNEVNDSNIVTFIFDVKV
jgi:hypothetical protein